MKQRVKWSQLSDHRKRLQLSRRFVSATKASLQGWGTGPGGNSPRTGEEEELCAGESRSVCCSLARRTEARQATSKQKEGAIEVLEFLFIHSKVRITLLTIP